MLIYKIMVYLKLLIGKDSYQNKFGLSSVSKSIYNTYKDYSFGLKGLFGITLLIVD